MIRRDEVSGGGLRMLIQTNECIDDCKCTSYRVIIDSYNAVEHLK
jgi:hypothetical protein